MHVLLTTAPGRLFLAAQALDALAIGVAGVALPWLVLDGGGSNGAAAAAYAATVAPYVALGLLAGRVGDRRDPRAVLLGSHAAQAAAAALVPLWALAAAPPVPLVLAAALAVGSGRVFADAAAFPLVAAAVGRERFASGQAALSAAWSVGLLAGPALGGAAVAAVGAARGLALEAGALALAAAAIAAIPRGPARELPAGGGDASRGASLLLRDPALRSLTAANLAWCAVVGGAYALTVPFLRGAAALGPREVGAVLAASAGAGLLAVPFVGVLTERLGGRRTVLAGLAATPAAAALVAAADGLAGCLLAFPASTLALSVTAAALVGERQRLAPAGAQARVGIAGRMLMLGTMSASALAWGAAADRAPLRAVYAALAAGGAAAALAGWLLLRRGR